MVDHLKAECDALAIYGRVWREVPPPGERQCMETKAHCDVLGRVWRDVAPPGERKCIPATTPTPTCPAGSVGTPPYCTPAPTPGGGGYPRPRPRPGYGGYPSPRPRPRPSYPPYGGYPRPRPGYGGYPRPRPRPRRVWFRGRYWCLGRFGWRPCGYGGGYGGGGARSYYAGNGCTCSR